jgi:lysophospholipase L1-like esterase
MVLGDSLAAGWMDCRAGCEGVEYNWPGLALGDQAWVFNRGIGNSTSADLLARWEQDTAGAEVLLVIIGVNDFARGVPTEALLANLEAMRARAEAQGQAIFFSTVWPAATTPPERQTELAALNAELLRRGQDSGWGVIDLYTPLSDPDHPGRLRPEEIAHPGSAHPNQAGYARAAAALEQAWP